MAWPYSPHTTFVDNSTPYVNAAFLNDVQTAINDTYNADQPWVENWNYDTAETPGSGYQNAYLPDHRWKAITDGTTSKIEPVESSVLMWPTIKITPDVAANKHIGLYSATRLWGLVLPSGITTSLSSLVNRGNAVDAAFEFYWGASSVQQPPFAGGHYAMFKKDVGSVNWKCVTRGGGSETSTTTSTVFLSATSTVQLLRIDITSANVKFYVDDVLVATHTTNLPTGNARFQAVTYANAAVSSTLMLIGPTKLSVERWTGA